jgi:hypothetical protein
VTIHLYVIDGRGYRASLNKNTIIRIRLENSKSATALAEEFKISFLSLKYFSNLLVKFAIMSLSPGVSTTVAVEAFLTRLLRVDILKNMSLFSRVRRRGNFDNFTFFCFFLMLSKN